MTMTSIWLFCFLSFLLGHGHVAKLGATQHVYRNLQTLQSTSTKEPYRTAYHFQPPKSWMNGPMIYKGQYHLFYQYNPEDAVNSKGKIVWAHSTSKDLVNWIPHDHAISPSQPYDINGCWSGSTTILPGDKPVILYTGLDPQRGQVQNLAVPKNLSDPFLREWVKSPENPLMVPNESNGINPGSFRDPTTAWLGHDGKWRVIVGSEKDGIGLAILYRSKDFVHWTKAQNPLHSENRSVMWECPDFFPVSINSTVGVDTSAIDPEFKHVLKVSLAGTNHDYYTIGSYDIDKDVYAPDKGSALNASAMRYDYGKFYASKTFFDGDKKRRILWAWISESSSQEDANARGWSGIQEIVAFLQLIQTIPRTLWLHKSGEQLVQWPIQEIETLRVNQVTWPSKVLEGGSVVEVSKVTAEQADVEISFKVTGFEKAEVMDPSWTNTQILCSRKGASVKGGLGPFGLLVLASKGLEEYTAVLFRIFKAPNKYVVLMCSDQSRSSLDQNNDDTTYGTFLDVDPVNEELSLRSLIDHSIVESFGGEGKACITSRVYPTLAIDGGAHLYAFNYGPMIYKGLYHLFYQYNPEDAVNTNGRTVWAHSTSTDLVNWIPQDTAISPSQPYDVNGCWSGSATILPGDKPVILYTGRDPQNQEAQNLAVPKNLSDPFLREWVKSPENPLMVPNESNGINPWSFRDPTTAWLGHDGKWRVIVGAEEKDGRGLAILYRSRDFVHWTKAQYPLHSENHSGMWECPDFFPVSINSTVGVNTSALGPEFKHVLKVSIFGISHDYYTIGSYNIDKDVYAPDKGSVLNASALRIDYGKFYASKTFFDSDRKRRILWAWINESSSTDDDIAKGWSGIQAIPRTLWLHKSGKQLVQWPITEIETLRVNQVSWPSKVLEEGSVVEVPKVTAEQADIEVSFKVTGFEKAEVMDPRWTDPQILCSRKGASVKGGLGPFGLLVLASKGLEEYTSVLFRIFKAPNKYVVLMCSDQSRSSLNENNDKTTYGTFLDVDPVNEKLSLRSLIDHSIVESFGGEGKACITSRVYPTLAIEGGAHLYAFNNGTQNVQITNLSAWSMKKTKFN
ncbi:hypothetical protein FNV43_RR25206 [Rhamnella rubrinervis]|uniref:Beta-fructofuranosidase n=1 Tax=Rhamnella rubrinervis TaxID=2594499 RepID=A0A8K0DTU8_9ROSA|nr:hypothetical protein FNV43_RR25206 [Rhamnella rubrinervis]